MYRQMNFFLFEVGVEISDHPMTSDQSAHLLNVAVQLGDIILQGNVLFPNLYYACFTVAFKINFIFRK